MLLEVISWNGGVKDVTNLTLTFTSTNVIITIFSPDLSSSQKTARLEFEQVQFLQPRLPEKSLLSFQIVTLPKPWISAFEMLTALRSMASIHDIRIDVVPKTGVMLRTLGNNCSRTLIQEAELYSCSVKNFGETFPSLAFMISFKEFKLAFDLALILSTSLYLYFDTRPATTSKADPGPLIIQIPSPNGIETQFVMSTLIPGESDDLIEESTVMSKSSHHENGLSDPDHVSESELGSNDETHIPPTPPFDF